MREYFYNLLEKYLKLYVRETDSFIEESKSSRSLQIPSQKNKMMPDYYILNGSLHYEKDIQKKLVQLKEKMSPETRLIVIYYSQLWKPIFRLADFLGAREKTSEQNWLSHSDIRNFLLLAGYDTVKSTSKVLIPIYIPLISNLVNRYLAPLPLFSWMCMTNVMIARPLFEKKGQPPSVSVVVPARNEAGNIENAILRLPKMGPDDELIFVEGNSTDNTWQVIEEVYEKYKSKMNLKICRQEGKGKGDAVRKGFSIASKDILMILDADLTVPPEDLPKFYHAIKDGVCEFANGSRLVYPMESQAMRFANMIGNKFFAMAFSFVLEQEFKDTLCGTKVMTKKNYDQIVAGRSYFGDFDPFGDFDLIFGASRLGLKIVEVPISYKDRTYGDTNIQRWRHGVILLRMLIFAARRIKFL